MNTGMMFKGILMGLCIQFLSLSAQAFTVLPAKWASKTMTMRAHSKSFPPGNAYTAALATVVSRWNTNPSKFRFKQTYNDPSVSLGNGENEVWFSTDADACNPAVTYSWWDEAGNLTETDVCFYVNERYTASMSKLSLWTYGGSFRPFQTTAMHEYGHVLGLGHEADEYNIMGQDWTHLSLNGSTARSYSGEDANYGAVFLYGLASGEDMGVVHMKRTRAVGEYSWHDLTKMYNSSRVELPFTVFNGQRRYNVSRGQTVLVEFTYENNGATYKTPNVGLYLSTDSTINTADTRFNTFNVGVRRNDVMTYSRTITIPNWLTRGSTYYLGAITDWNKLIPEVTEENNAAYHIIRVN